MGQLDVHIRHGGGGLNSSMFWVIIIAVLIIASGVAAGVSASITALLVTLLLWLVSVLGGAVVIGSLVWYLTRDYRKAQREAIVRMRADREEAHHRRQLEMHHARAQITAAQNASMAAMIAEAVRAGQPQWPFAGYSPPIRAEVIKPEDDNDR